MLAHTFLLGWRNALRNKSSFIINIAGLSIGLSVALVVYLWVSDELAIDRFHDKDVYQVMRRLVHEEGDVEVFHNNSDLLAPALREEMPEIEQVVAYSDFPVKGVLWNAEKKFKSSGGFAEPEFFKMFSYKLLEGDPSDVLNEKFSIVISDKLALKFFGTTTGVIGKQISLDEEKYAGNFVISGVFEQTRFNSEPFDFIGTYEYYREHNSMNIHWDSNTVDTYITLRPGTDINAFDLKVREFVRMKFKAQYGKENLHWIGRLFIRPFADRYLYNTYGNGIQSGGRIEYVILFTVIGVLILVIACINFMNLVTARASKRMKEIGVKKAVGAGRHLIALQHLTESLITAFLALILSFGMIAMVLPSFNDLSGKDLTLSITFSVIGATVMITLITGIVAGVYPALYLSALRPVDILKGKLKAAYGEAFARKGLVIFQFCVSMLLIIAVLIVKQQIDFIQSKNLGYSRNNIVTFETEGTLRFKNMNSFLDELRNAPGVEYATNMSGNLMGAHGGGGGIEWPGKDHRVEFAALYVNFDLMEMLGVTMSEGRMFSSKFLSDSSAVIFNETAIHQMNLKDPIGQKVKLWGQEATVIGVVKDFNFESLYDNVKPFMFRFSKQGENVMIKLQPGNEREAIAAVEKLYAKFNPGIDLSYRFLDDQYAALYAAEERVGKLSLYFAGIAIFISALGLFGLISFAAERRLKEIGVRKVLGASEFGIVLLLSWDFFKLLIFAAIIALPLGYLFAHEWLNTFAFRIELQWWHFVFSCAVIFVIAWVTISSQAFKAARSNPVNALRSE
jgi:putative ABC transport system permease protein